MEGMTQDQELDLWIKLEIQFGSKMATEIMSVVKHLPVEQAEFCIRKTIAKHVRGRNAVDESVQAS